MKYLIMLLILAHTVSVLSSPPLVLSEAEVAGRLGGACTKLKVYDVNGKIVFEDKVEEATDVDYELNLDVKSGIYFIEVLDLNTDTYYKQKLIVQK